MKRSFRHGLIIGKFYPPHLGHHHLVDTAAPQVDRLTVLVLASRVETIPLASRVRWLDEVHAGQPQVRVLGGRCDIAMDLESETAWAAHIALMRAVVEADTSEPIDVVFSSEEYGPEMARRFGAVHVAVDPPRAAFPFSSTAVREDLPGAWDMLHPVVQGGLTARVVVLGAESTGTSTVSRALAESYRHHGGVWERTRLVPEYGREYTVLKHTQAGEDAHRDGLQEPGPAALEWVGDDFGHVAREQSAMEEAAARDGSPLLVCDTDALATTVWERRYVGPGSHLARAAADALPPRAAYLLTDHVEVPFEQDGWRDGEHLRGAMTTWFIEELTARGESWTLLSGTLEERLALARQVTDEALAHSCRFGVPLGFGQAGGSRG